MAWLGSWLLVSSACSQARTEGVTAPAPFGSASPPSSAMLAERLRARQTIIPASSSSPGPGPTARASSGVPPAASTPVSAPSSAAPVPTPDAPARIVFEGGKGSVHSRNGLVVAVEAAAARAGATVLESGGNAVDAAVATLFALCVTHPSAASLGGGGFALVRAPGGPTRAFDFRESAPAALNRTQFDAMQRVGARDARAVGVPGVVAGAAALHGAFATRSWADSIAPALRLARDGYVLGAHQARLIRASRPRFDRAAERAFPSELFKSGARVRQPDLARTLERLATAGAPDFYAGEIAARLVSGLAPDGPTLADLRAYQALERTPLQIEYRGLTLETMPPPSAGGIALIGTLLAQSEPALPRRSAAALHELLEAERRAQSQRKFAVADPARYEAANARARELLWLSPAFWHQWPIDPEHATPSSRLTSSTDTSAESDHTTHLSVVDRNGMVVSLTTTLSASFGAKVVAAGTGIVMNNSVASFSTSGENTPSPGRRTVSSMAPSLLLQGGETRAVLGTPGGDTIPSTLAQVIRNLVDYRLPLDQAVEEPRFHQRFLPDEARYENRVPLPRSVIKALEARGHRLRPGRAMGDAHCIVLDGLDAYGHADSRESGIAVPARQ
ncbi:MAG TPA: gamma-glutamyltransferase [Polyangiaceae bacterium]|nr:gamma-glutamyltransferase [Polyangiaceae bacterium]